MKNDLIRYTLFFVLIIFFRLSPSAQTINWKAKDEPQKNSLYATMGIDHGVYVQVGYAHKLRTNTAIYLSTAISAPFGEEFMDDYKMEIASLIEVFSIADFRSTARLHTFFRRHQSSTVSLLDLGSGLAFTNGLYYLKGHIAIELGLQRSGFTRLRHFSSEPKEKNQWFKGASSQLFYGFQGSKNLSVKTILTFKLGAFVIPGKDQSSSLPLYLQLGLNKKI